MAYEIISLGEDSASTPLPGSSLQPKKLTQEQTTPQQPSPLGTLARGAGGLALRAGEAIAGLPGDVVQGVSGLIDTGFKKLTGVSPLDVSQQLSHFLGGYDILGDPVKKLLPTSAQLREKGRKIVGDQFEPQSDVERNLQEFVSTVAPMMFGGAPAAARALAAGGAGQLAKFGLEKIGAPEWAQNTIKTGTMLGASLIGIPTMESFGRNLYQKAEELVPKKLPIPASDIVKEIRSVQKKISGRHFPQKKILLNNIDAIEDKINILSKTPSIPAEKIWDLKKDINEWLRSPEIKKAPTVRTELSKMGTMLGDKLKSETTKTHPEFSRALSEADDIWRTIRGTEKASTVIGSAVQKLNKKLTPTSLTLLAYLFRGKAASAAIGLGTAKLGKSVVDAIKTSINTPGIRHYYQTILKDALKNNQPAVMNGLKRFDKALQKEMAKQTVVDEPEAKGYEILSLGD